MTLNPNPSMTAEAFEAFLKQPVRGNRLWELIEGQLIERGNTREQGMIVSRILYLLYNHTHKHDRGQVAMSIWHHQAGDLYNVRMPNIAYYAAATRPVVKEVFASIYPDLVVEVKALDEDETAITGRGLFYLTRGTKIVWLVYPDQRLIDVMTNNSIKTLASGNVLTGGDILPKFSVPVADIFQLAPSGS